MLLTIGLKPPEVPIHTELRLQAARRIVDPCICIAADVKLEGKELMRVSCDVRLISGCLAGLTRMHNFTVARTGGRPNGALTLQDNHLSS